MANDVKVCQECGAELTSDSLQGLCAQCLLKQGLVASASGVSGQTSAVSGQSALDKTVLDTEPRKPRAGSLPREGQRFGDYQIVRMLGQGGMGTVFEADHLPSERRVALKVLNHALDSPEARQRFLREGQLAASINHPNTVYVFGTEEIDGIPVISMELAPGGTLKDRVKEKGPLPVTEAVDVILQVIAGLEAAHAKGVLHRDIKPANCFVDSDGTVKVGDFGLSISTQARAETQLTATGRILGTPAFASPEQLRGDELDVRSDIYSVGAALYYLLTGKVPFEETNLVKLLTMVVERAPKSPQKLRPEIPKGLAQVVLRCLDKKKEERFGDYTEVQNALLPFRPTTLSPALRGPRILAGFIDLYVIWLSALPWTSVPVLQSSLAAWLSVVFNPISSIPVFVFWLFRSIDSTWLICAAAYFALTEGLWGASLGKLLCGLRVVGQDQKILGVWKSFLRALLFVAALYGPVFVFQSEGVRPWVEQGQPTNWWVVGSFICLLYLSPLLLIFVAARPENGFAGCHELLSKTRVVDFRKTGRQLQGQAQDQPTTEPPTRPTGVSTVGPYQILGSLHKTGGEQIFLGFDERLRRKIWIRKLSKEESPFSMSRSRVSRSGRLRWVNGRRTRDEHWDAYEALTGGPLLSQVAKPQPWSLVRQWLFDLAEELNAAAKGGTWPFDLGLDRVWITAASRAKLLDFPAPGLDPPIDGDKQMAPGVASTDSTAANQVQAFLYRVATVALLSSAINRPTTQNRVATPPLPLHASHFLRELKGRSFQNTEDLVARIKSLLDKVPTVSRKLRFSAIAWCSVPIIVLLGLSLGLLAQTLELMRASARMNPNLVRISFCLRKLEVLRREAHQADDKQRKLLKSLEIYIVSKFPELRADLIDQEKSSRKPGLLHMMELLETRAIFDAHQSPSNEEIEAATAIWQPIIRQIETEKVIRDAISARMSRSCCFPAFRISCFLLIASLISIFVFQTPVVFHFKAIAVVAADGSKASRSRLALRSVVAWMPALMITFFAIQASPALFHGFETRFQALAFGFPILNPRLQEACGWLVILLIGLAILSFASSLATPERSPQDRLAGTWLVPR